MSRAIAYNNTGSLAIYIMQATFLLLPPIFFAASMYMVYSRIVRSVVNGPAFSLIAPRWSTRLFVLGDFLCLNIQGNGAGLLADQETVHIGNPIVVTGLIFQVLLFLGFILMCYRFHQRFRRHLAETGAACDVPWRSYLLVLYCMSAAILGRNVYRVVEYIMGDDGYLMQTEWPTFAFDSAPMFAVMVAFGIWFPGGLRPRERDSMIELNSEAGLAEQGPSTKSANPTVYSLSKRIVWNVLRVVTFGIVPALT